MAEVPFLNYQMPKFVSQASALMGQAKKTPRQLIQGFAQGILTDFLPQIVNNQRLKKA